ncbi:MAG TPA: gliding motility-associated ABC transporter substrate-binding protein GldG [Bacteroidales bacterium]|nr:gliding motility-associated ABC transporter substrate-binding protein GldG [Bacteroidales bacterium]
MNLNDRRIRDILEYVSIMTVLILIVITGSLFSFRLDLTSDKRHTISAPAREILRSLRDDIYVQVYFDGDMPVGFKRLKRSASAMLEEFRHYSGRKINYLFINPSESEDDQERNRYHVELINKGLNPVNIFEEDDEGGQIEKIIFPGMIVNYNGIELPVNFLKNNQSLSAEQNLLHSIEGLEYELIQAISTISSDTVYRIAFLEGQDEYDEVEVADITLELAKFFTIDRGSIGGQPGILDDYAALVIAGPGSQFEEEDKLVIDQFIMAGGKVLWFVEQVDVNRDSLAMGGSMALFSPLNIEDQLFKYGVRINPVLIQDTDCMIIPVRKGSRNNQPQYLPVPWIYYPLLYTSGFSPVTRNLNKVKGEFVNYIDTVGGDPAIRKQLLLATSPNSRYVSPPRLISLDEFRDPPPEDLFNQSFLPVAVLLEGEFTSLYKNRISAYDGRELADKSRPTKMIVVADGDIIRNDVSIIGNRVTPLPLGQDRYSGQVFGNKDFIVNCLNWLVDDKGIVDLRSREMRIRLLDSERINKERLLWQLMNSAGPILIVALGGLIYSIIRKRKFAVKK